MRLKVTTEHGYEAELSTHVAASGKVVAKAAAIWRGVRTPAIELFAFEGEDAPARAERYMRRLSAALVDRDALEGP
jgi:hypothetical protein